MLDGFTLSSIWAIWSRIDSHTDQEFRPALCRDRAGAPGILKRFGLLCIWSMTCHIICSLIEVESTACGGIYQEPVEISII